MLDFIGGLLSDQSRERQNQANIDNQKLFAKKGLQWKAADAKAAGLHPLFAMGAPTMSFTPNPVTGSGVGDALQTMARKAKTAKIDKLNQELLRQQIAESHSRTANNILENQMRKANFIEQQLEASAIKTDQAMANAVQDAQLQADVMAKTRTTPEIAGKKVKPGNLSDAEVIEQRYGEVASILYGLMVLGSDAYTSFKEKFERDKQSLGQTGQMQRKSIRSGVR